MDTPYRKNTYFWLVGKSFYNGVYERFIKDQSELCVKSTKKKISQTTIVKLLTEQSEVSAFPADWNN